MIFLEKRFYATNFGFADDKVFTYFLTSQSVFVNGVHSQLNVESQKTWRERLSIFQNHWGKVIFFCVNFDKQLSRGKLFLNV